jgi:hypothetical protein
MRGQGQTARSQNSAQALDETAAVVVRHGVVLLCVVVFAMRG